jgi:type I restriction enzyme R subunit
MSEYLEVEKPFLDQLAGLGWMVIDQGGGVPTEPVRSLRESFRQYVLPEVFAEAVSAINTTADGQAWLTGRQIGELHD